MCIRDSPTMLSGDIGIQNDSLDNAYHVLYIDGTTDNGNITTDCIIDGFQVVDGFADGSFPNNDGGGIFNNGEGASKECSPSILNCNFTNNTARHGGAIYNVGRDGESSPTLTNCTFTNNATTSRGGAIYNLGFQGTSSPILTNCTFTNNTAEPGGAIYNDGSNGTSSPTLTNCIFTNNTATNNRGISLGGAIYNSGDGNTSCLLYTSPSPRDATLSRMPSSA